MLRARKKGKNSSFSFSIVISFIELRRRNIRKIRKERLEKVTSTSEQSGDVNS